MHTEHEPAPVSDEGRTWAYLSYGSVLTGIPFCFVPFIQRNDAFALYHARQAALVYLGMWVLVFVYVVISLITCGLGGFLFPVLLLPYVPAIHGFVLVSNGEAREPMGVFGLGNALFGGIQVEQKP